MSARAASIASAAPPAQGLSSETRRVAWVVSSVFFIEQMDATILGPALPAMAADLGSDPITLSAAITAYLLGLTVLIPLSGRLAERYGDRRVFVAAVALFLASSLACGFATNATTLIALRFAQGLAGALMAPVGRLIVLRSAARHEIVEAMALVILVAMIAPMLGPFLGGLLTDWLGWRWIFWINGPLCVASLWLILRCLPAGERQADVRFDGRGMVLTGLGFAALMWGLTTLGDVGSARWHAVAALGAGVLLLGVYVRHAHRCPRPVLSLALLRVRSFRDAMAAGSAFRVAVGGMPFLLPLTLQTVYGYTPLQAGMLVLLPAAGGFAMKFFSTGLLRRLAYRRALLLHGLLASAMLLVVGWVDPGASIAVYAAVLVVFGWARSLQMNAFGTLAYADVDKAGLAAATSFFLSVQNLTVAIGVAVAALGLRVAEAYLPLIAAHGLTYSLLGLVGLISVGLTAAMPRDAGRHLLKKG